MNIKFKDIKFLLAAVIIFSGAVQSHRILLNPAETQIDTEKIEQTLVRLEQEAEASIDTAVALLKTDRFTFLEADSMMLPKDKSVFADFSNILLIYKNNALKYWSKNTVQTSHSYDKNNYKTGEILKIANGWYEPIIKQDIGYKFVALIKIKNDFSYKNKYLKNGYNKAFDIPAATDISAKPARGAVNINGKDGNIVFSLNYSKTINSISEFRGLISLLYFLSFAFLLLFFNHLFQLISHKKYFVLWLSLFSVAILGGRWLMISYKAPFFIYALSFFEPGVYAGGAIFPLLGDFFINAMLILFFAENFFRIFNPENIINSLVKNNPKWIYVVVFIFVILSAAFFKFLVILNENLIFNSTISYDLFRIREISAFTISVYVIFGILLVAYFVFIDKIFKISNYFLSFKKLILPVLLSLIIAEAIGLLLFPPDYISSAFLLVSMITILAVRSFKKEYSIYILMVFIGMSSIYSVWFIANKSEIKNKQIQKMLVTQLYDERDDVAELLIREIDNRLEADTVLRSKILNVHSGHKLDIHDYLTRKYFYGYWDKYKLFVTLCGNTTNYPEANQADYCNNYFTEVLRAYDKKLNNSKFYYINNSDGTITYFTSITISEKFDERSMSLYIQLKEKPNLKKIGYPELLIDEEVKIGSVFDNYSYAKYNKGTLAARSGDFTYNFSEDLYRQKSEQNIDFFRQNNYLHYLYTFNKANMIVLSRKLPQKLDHVISFSYLFVFFSLLIILSVLLVNHKFLFRKLNPDFKNKIQFTIILFLTATFIVFTAGTVYYATEQDKKQQQKVMAEKIQSVLVEFEHKFENETELTPNWYSEKYDHLDELLIKFSQVFFIDINLYDTKGYLLATSRSEVFQRKLQAKQMDSKAFAVLAGEKRNQFIQNETIGDYEYASIYVPFKNKNNKIIAYLNLPFFVQYINLQNNISALLISTVNIYIIFFLISVFVAVLISNSISRPLRMLQSKFKQVQLGQEHQEVLYTKDDEIGDLVKEYNRMVEELQESVRKLAESERESAWREMAKQIAHEIKNPLTPMKLSVQLLQRTWKNKDEDFSDRLKKVSGTLIEQIDTLSAIASEFSAFAKMPKAQNEEVDLLSKLRTVVQLFDNQSEIKINSEFHNLENVKILADKEQLSRVFINIIKNGIQSVPEGILVEIFVELTVYGNNAKITIEDNGSGIPENKKDKLFIPSFTTKTKGMGMGLAIVKNIINNAQGEIWFESEENKGTKFFIEFPLLEN
ncbi:MAG: ATP-binding protein [Bacteroidota bacterium]|nr:ATP-binding protein [Bacteroidota bacterium]